MEQVQETMRTKEYMFLNNWKDLEYRTTKTNTKIGSCQN
jgi:hypothetical protein